MAKVIESFDIAEFQLRVNVLDDNSVELSWESDCPMADFFDQLTEKDWKEMLERGLL